MTNYDIEIQRQHEPAIVNEAEPEQYAVEPMEGGEGNGD